MLAGIEAASYALAALCCDSLSTAIGNDFQLYSQALSRAASAIAEKGLHPSDEVCVHMCVCTCVLGMLCVCVHVLCVRVHANAGAA